MKTCENCPRRDKCKKLCKSMERILNEETKSFSFRWTKPKFIEASLTDNFEFPNIMASKSYRAWVYELHFLDKKDCEFISLHLPLEKETIEDMIYSIREDIDKVDNENKKIILREHLVNGLSIFKTHKKTGFSQPYIYRVLKEYIYYWGVEND
jgi:hypothetical protein